MCAAVHHSTFRPHLPVFGDQNPFVLVYRECLSDLEQFLRSHSVPFERGEVTRSYYQLLFPEHSAGEVMQLLTLWQTLPDSTPEFP